MCVAVLTNSLVTPLRKALPGLWGLDLASLLPAYLLQVVLAVAVVSLHGGSEAWSPLSLWPVLLWQGVLATLRMSIYLLIAALVVQAVLSWVSPYSPLTQPVGQLTRPFLSPIQRVTPSSCAVDLSPFIAIVLAQLVLMFL